MEFKGTKGKLQKVYATGVCIGIGVVLENGYIEMTANSILPDVEEFTNKQIEAEMTKLEADMTLYAHAPEMLEMLNEILTSDFPVTNDRIKDLITRATTI